MDEANSWANEFADQMSLKIIPVLSKGYIKTVAKNEANVKIMMLRNFLARPNGLFLMEMAF